MSAGMKGVKLASLKLGTPPLSPAPPSPLILTPAQPSTQTIATPTPPKEAAGLSGEFIRSSLPRLPRDVSTETGSRRARTDDESGRNEGNGGPGKSAAPQLPGPPLYLLGIWNPQRVPDLPRFILWTGGPGGRRALVVLDFVDGEIPVRVGTDEDQALNAVRDLGGSPGRFGEGDGVLEPLRLQRHGLLRVAVAVQARVQAVAAVLHLVGLRQHVIERDLAALGGRLGPEGHAVEYG